MAKCELCENESLPSDENNHCMACTLDPYRRKKLENELKYKNVKLEDNPKSRLLKENGSHEKYVCNCPIDCAGCQQGYHCKRCGYRG